MDFRNFGEKRAVQRPSVEVDELTEPEVGFKGQFAVSGVRCEGDDWTDVTGEGRISRSVLSRVGLSGSRWEPLELSDVELTGVDVSNAVWSRVSAHRVEVVSCRATGWRLSLELAWDLYVADSRLDYAAIEVVRSKGLVVFERCTFEQAQLSGDLSDVLLLDCELEGAEFAATAARGCDLRSSRLAGARGLGSLRGARITEDQAVSVAGELAREAGFRFG